MFESSANVTIKSVIAEQMYPIITPHITSIDIFFTRPDTSSINPMDNIAPTNADIISVAELTAIPCPRNTIMATDTVSFAPDDIPSTNGPAMGFPKKVWSKYPDTDNAPP